MDFLRQQLVILQERLRGLTPSQKLLSGALVVILMMTMLYWGRLASTGETVPLFPTPVSAAELPAIANALSAAGITYTTDAGVVSVPKDRQQDAMNAITTAAAIPGGGGESALEAMVGKFTPLATQSEFNVMLQAAHSRNLITAMKSWPGVKDVNIEIRESQRGTLTPSAAGAFINLTTSNGTNARKVAALAVAAVVPTVPYLTPDNVTVSVNGIAVIKAGSGGEGGGLSGGELMENQTQYERDFGDSLKSYLQIPNLRVIVKAEVNGEIRHEKITTPDAKNKVSMPTESNTEKTQTTDAAAPAEPGAVPNMGLDAGATASASRGGSKTERTEERFENKVGMTEAEVRTGPGQMKIVGVSVGIPREYFINTWKFSHKGAEPSDEELATITKSELEKKRAELLVAANLKDPSALVVNDYVDFDNSGSDTMLASATLNAAAPGTISLIASSHGKEAAIGALALTSLFMVGRMVKKSAPSPSSLPLLALDDMPDVSSGKKGRKPGTLGGVDIVGEVGEGGSIMMGQELDEEVLETSQMVEQVSGFVKENPDTTAQLLKRWMNRE